MIYKFGSIEAGGTKFVLAVGNEDLGVLIKETIPTTTPEETLQKTIAFFRENHVHALGIGSFGPIDGQVGSPTYGYITTTPKAGWWNTDLLGALQAALKIPMTFTTDVNASADGELMVTGAENLVYYTIGTGIGAGAVQDGEFVGGVSHAEMGHIFVKKHPADGDFKGVCPFHGDCLEGLASGPALEARTGVKGEEIPADSEIWDIEAYYLTQVAVNATLTLRPAKIVFGGGVAAHAGLIEKVREAFRAQLNGYVTWWIIYPYPMFRGMARRRSETLLWHKNDY
jgi:fructokinase